MRAAFIRAAHRWHDPEGPDSWTAYLYLALSCVVGVCIGWAGVNAQFYLTATSFMVVGNLNKFVVIAVGMLAMGESSSYEAIIGCVVAISGGFLYGLARMNLNETKKLEEDAKAKREAEEKKSLLAHEA